ncbi:MAG: hypothetical protein ACTS73_08650 [Arsenophonus sp. NEOnobi-MAG3]
MKQQQLKNIDVATNCSATAASKATTFANIRLMITAIFPIIFKQRYRLDQEDVVVFLQKIFFFHSADLLAVKSYANS